MDIKLQPGRYVVAVSGGVDSVVLLHALHTMYHLPSNDYQFTVAHFDHGIRADSHKDRVHVQGLSRQYNLPFVYDEGGLGSGASEAEARDARYAFLHKVRSSSGARAVITAHHQDDLLETAILNMLRGTGRKGISSLKSTDIVKRPLLHLPKTDIHNYARANKLKWREDSTNTNTKYKRNHVRHTIVPKLTMAKRAELLRRISDVRTLNTLIDDELLVLHGQPYGKMLSRRLFLRLPFRVAVELLAEWLRENGIRGFDRKSLQRMTTHMKTLRHGQRIDVDTSHFIVVGKSDFILTTRLPGGQL
jgi:tRNA(Ile)-lysidine synthetase-like protein